MTPSLSHLFVAESLLTEQQELSFLPLPSTIPARGAEVSSLGLQLPPPEDTEKRVLWLGKGVATAHTGSVTQASAAQPGVLHQQPLKQAQSSRAVWVTEPAPRLSCFSVTSQMQL